jgi:hypothetical protein
MLPFTKLNLNFNVGNIDTDANNLEMHFEYSVPQKYGIALKKHFNFVSVPNSTYEIEANDKQKVLKYLPKELLDIEVPEVWILNIKPADTNDATMLAPHVDKVRKCCINIYIDTHGEKTTYYDYKAGNIKEIGSFVARDGECWALDSDTPHSVLLSPPHIRKAVSISFINTPYSCVIKKLNEVKCV